MGIEKGQENVGDVCSEPLRHMNAMQGTSSRGTIWESTHIRRGHPKCKKDSNQVHSIFNKWRTSDKMNRRLLGTTLWCEPRIAGRTKQSLSAKSRPIGGRPTDASRVKCADSKVHR